MSANDPRWAAWQWRVRAQGLGWPPPAEHQAILDRARTEAPGALGNAMDCSRRWDDVARRVGPALEAAK